MDLQWYDIEPHQIRFRGVDSSRVTLVADRVLATNETRSDPSAIGFTGTIEIRHRGSVNVIFSDGFYGDLFTFRSQLFDIRNGEKAQAELNMPHLYLTLYPHELGIRSGIVIEGEYSSALQPEVAPWPKSNQGVGDFLLQRDEQRCFNIRFGFLMSQVDPPYLDNAIKDIDQLYAYLNSGRNTAPDVSP